MSDRAVQDAVRDQLVAAAVRDHQPPAPLPRRRRRRWRLRIAGLLVVSGLGVAAAAQGTGLLSEGKSLDRPFPGLVDDARVQAVDGPRLTATAPNPGGRYPFGVGVFTSRTGLNCVLAGQALGTKLGVFRDKRFHPYGPEVPGVCIDLDKRDNVQDMMHIGSKTVVYGLATASRTPPAALLYDGKRYEPTLGSGGSYLFVIDASVDINRLKEAS